MLYLLSIALTFLVTISLINATTDDQSGHQHTRDSIYDCECTTGITTDMLDCDDINKNLDGLQNYLVDNDCSQYCMNLMYIGNSENAFKCFQVFTILVQYHDYCTSGTVNETLFHQYLEKCPDCLQKHYYVVGADECEGHLVCNDTTSQETDVQYVLNNCIDSCDGDCNSTWKTVQGYHRMCHHGELSEEFDTLYDKAAFSNTVCQNIECNVPWEANYTVNCSNSVNMQYIKLNIQYGNLDIDEILAMDESKGINQSIVTLFISFVFILFAVAFV